jgi:nitrite reductase/ring-hydroxylating ferredoxin subunit
MTQAPAAADRDALDKRYVVARAADIPEGDRLIVNVLGRSIGIFNVDGVFYAMLNRCPHRGAQLCKGDVLGLVQADYPGAEVRLESNTKFIVCPWHGWEYDIETGQSWFNPGHTRARPFEVLVERGQDVEQGLAQGAAVAIDGDAAFVDPTTHRIKGPYTAEVIPVTVEDDYVVISLRRWPTSTEEE